MWGSSPPIGAPPDASHPNPKLGYKSRLEAFPRRSSSDSGPPERVQSAVPRQGLAGRHGPCLRDVASGLSTRQEIPGHPGMAFHLADAGSGRWDLRIEKPELNHCQVPRNISLNGIVVPEREPLLRKGISIWWLGDFLFVDSGLGVRVKFDGRSTVYVTIGTALQGTTRGLCGIYNDNPADDFQRVEGDVVTLAASFGNSWRIPEIGL
ncbi:hypothetical protein L345_13725, partial [Ophiophagus hannah]